MSTQQESEQQFNILNYDKLPSIPWRLVEPHREQAVRNHGQTLERLHERGGLSPVELWHVVHGSDWKYNRITKEAAYQWLHDFVTPSPVTPSEQLERKFRDLALGDRFRSGTDLWTVVDFGLARRHSPESNALGDRGYGYLGDAICSFDPNDSVRFQPVSTPATPSADEEIERYEPNALRSGIVPFDSGSFVLYSDHVAKLALLSASHANEREEWIKRAEEWRINAEEKRNHLKTAEATLAAREGEIERIRGQLLSHERMAAAGVYVETEKYSGMVVQISTLQAELATAQSRVKELEEICFAGNEKFVEKLNVISALRSQLTEAQEWRNGAEKKLFETGKLIPDLVEKLEEANAKLAGLESVIDFIRDAAFRIHGDTGVQKIDAALKGRVSP